VRDPCSPIVLVLGLSVVYSADSGKQDLQGDFGVVAGEDFVGGDLEQVLQGAVAGLHNGAVYLGAAEDFPGGGGTEPGLQDGRDVGGLAEFVVQQPLHTVVPVFGDRDGSRRGQEPVRPVNLFCDLGQCGGVQRVQNVRDGRVRDVRVDGEGSRGLDPAVLGLAYQEPGRAVMVGLDVVEMRSGSGSA
jgi:hypothetical protein